MPESIDDSWDRALICSKKIGYVPSAFSQALRLLTNDELNNNGELRAVTKYQVARVFRGPSFMSMLYFLSLAVTEEKIKPFEPITIGDMLGFYKPLDLAAMITCLFLNRRMRKVAPDAWLEAYPIFSREVQMGAQVGVAVPALGHAPGILMATVRNVSQVLLSLHKPLSFEVFSDTEKATVSYGNDALESQLWGATSTQVATVLLAHLGFRSKIGEDLAAAINSREMVADIKDPQVQKLRLSLLWSECFFQEAKQPAETLDGAFFPFKKDLARAEAQVKKIRRGARGWIDRNRDDLTKEKAPHLFEERSVDSNLPVQLQEVFNAKEVLALKESEFDALIDQIDSEHASARPREDVIPTADLEELEKQVE
jgi:hypothetical protein